MNNDLAPSHQRLFGPYWLLWYSKSNNYSIVGSEFKTLLDYYFQSDSLDAYKATLLKLDSTSDPSLIAHNLNTYLQNCNVVKTLPEEFCPKFQASHRNITKQYRINGKGIQIHFDTDLVQKTIHPALAHLEVSAETENAQVVFDVYIDTDRLCLFKNAQLITSVPKRDYHLLQGKFVMQLLTTIYDNEESDWVGTFHGSTISDGSNSILFIGKSGKGKSTLCALLAANGFELLADDVSPMLSENSHIYHNPSAISIKAGAFSTLQTLITDFDSLPTTLFNTTKGPLKYIPCPTPARSHYPCKAIIMVNYKAEAATRLEPISIKEILETMIPDSWLSPNPEHAAQFLDWLGATQLFQLTYSDTDSVLATVSTIFNTFKADQ